MVAPPAVPVPHCVIGRGGLLLGMGPLLMKLRVCERESGITKRQYIFMIHKKNKVPTVSQNFARKKVRHVTLF